MHLVSRPRSADASGWRGELALATGWALFVGRAGDNTPHSHQALQLCVSGDEPFRLRTAIEDEPRSCVAVAIPPDSLHAIEGGASRSVYLYLDPSAGVGRAIATTLRDGGRAVRSASEVERVVTRLAGGERLATAARARELRDALAACWALSPVITAADPRISAATARIQATLRAGARAPTTRQLAREAALSESRLSALFRRESGVAIRRFVLWTRLRLAVEASARGLSLTEAAHHAGFADSAHLARTFRQMFGTTVSSSLGSFDILLID